MPVYESIKNADNKIVISAKAKDTAVFGWDKVVANLAQPAERISMPMHIHPSSHYVKEHFDEPLGRCETYYIAEAYHNSICLKY